MRVLVKEPIQNLELREIEDNTEYLQELVGGYFGMVWITDEIVCLYNEDGKSLKLGYNFYTSRHGWVVGTCIFASIKNTELASLSDKQIVYISKYVNSPIDLNVPQ